MIKLILMLAIPPLMAIYVAILLIFLDHESTTTHYALIIPISYVLGSIPWGFMITYAVTGTDIRTHGSGRTGMTNVLRTTGGKFAVLALLLDASKGICAVFLARIIADNPTAEVIAGVLSIAGHNWPFFLNFHGGRGIAPGLGALMAINPLVALLSLAVFVPITFITRYVSLGSIVAVIAAFGILTAFVLLGEVDTTYLWYTGVGGAIIIVKHKDNIQRLINHTERKLGHKSDKIDKPHSSGPSNET